MEVLIHPNNCCPNGTFISNHGALVAQWLDCSIAGKLSTAWILILMGLKIDLASILLRLVK